MWGGESGVPEHKSGNISETGALKSQVLENSSTEKVSTKQDNMYGWKIQVLKTQVRVRRVGKRKY